MQGCYSLSNPITVNRNQPEGGTLTGGPFTFCVGDGEADNIPAGSITLEGNSGTNSQWVVTDDQGNILGLPPMPSVVDFDGAGPGVCLVWHLSFEDGLQGAEVGLNANDLQGCYSLSNPITVNRDESGEACEDAIVDCQAPMEIEIDNIGRRKVLIDWENVPNARRYVIEVRFAGNTNIAGRAIISRSRVLVFAPAGRDFEFRISTLCKDGSESEFTDWLPFSTPSGLISNSAEDRTNDISEADIVLGEEVTNELSVFPNPVENEATINYKVLSESAQVRLFHVSGREVASFKIFNGASAHRLDLSDYPNGLYYLTVKEAGQPAISHQIVRRALY